MLTDTENNNPNLIDHSVKLLFREQPQAVLHLAGIEANGTAVRFEDSNLNIPELRADHVFIVEEAGVPPYAIYLEYQLRPEPAKLPLWLLKWAGLCVQLQMEVVLLAIYLERGDRATFPAAFTQSGGGLQTALSFNTIRLWEHRDRIVSGEWPELAPLLVLCEANPTEQTLQKEVELIHNSGLPHDSQGELLGIAALVALRNFSRTLVETIFREEMAMVKNDAEVLEDAKEFFREMGILQKWLKDPRVSGELIAEAKAEGEAEGIAKGKAEGEAEGIAKGTLEELRRNTLAILVGRFGELPEQLVERINMSDVKWVQDLFDRAIGATSLSELTGTP